MDRRSSGLPLAEQNDGNADCGGPSQFKDSIQNTATRERHRFSERKNDVTNPHH